MLTATFIFERMKTSVTSCGLRQARSAHAADLDGDGDSDVLYAFLRANTIAWHENLVAGDFGSSKLISSDAVSVSSVTAADLDGDGDLDVLAASLGDDTIAWYENVDGAGTFDSLHVITTRADGARSVFAADLDGGGDLDVLAASSLDDKIAWHKNLDGQGTFSDRIMICFRSQIELIREPVLLAQRI